jgi:hypothetical protein
MFNVQIGSSLLLLQCNFHFLDRLLLDFSDQRRTTACGCLRIRLLWCIAVCSNHLICILENTLANNKPSKRSRTASVEARSSGVLSLNWVNLACKFQTTLCSWFWDLPRVVEGVLQLCGVHPKKPNAAESLLPAGSRRPTLYQLPLSGNQFEHVERQQSWQQGLLHLFRMGENVYFL